MLRSLLALLSTRDAGAYPFVFQCFSEPVRIIAAENGNDTIYGIDGANTIYSGNLDDMLFGSESADSLFGEKSDDQLYGEQGEDYLDGGRGNDVVRGGLDDDTQLGGRGGDVFVLALGEGTDTILDYGVGEVLIGLVGLRFDDLTIGQSGDDATISSGGEVLAVLTGVDALTLNEADVFSFVWEIAASFVPK